MVNVISVSKLEIKNKTLLYISKKILGFNKSNSELKNLFKSNAVKVNGIIINDFEYNLDIGIGDKFFVFNFGKKYFYTLKYE
jgi:tyrosyl-tRNA synthetase